MLVLPHLIESHQHITLEIGILPVEVGLGLDSVLFGIVIVVLGAIAYLGIRIIFVNPSAIKEKRKLVLDCGFGGIMCII